MAQTKAGAIKRAARLIGVSVDDYLARQSAGEKWCVLCRAWHYVWAFGRDASRWDSLASACRSAKNSLAQSRHVPVPRSTLTGLRRRAARDGDQKQARRRVNYLVEAGLLPAPNSLPCVDCGHRWSEGERRHEYDHYLGYAPENHEKVEPVYTGCHHDREQERSETTAPRQATEARS